MAVDVCVYLCPCPNPSHIGFVLNDVADVSTVPHPNIYTQTNFHQNRRKRKISSELLFLKTKKTNERNEMNYNHNTHVVFVSENIYEYLNIDGNLTFTSAAT